MSVTFIALSKERLFEQKDSTDLLSAIPYCDGKSFEGTISSGMLELPYGWQATAFTINDSTHHNDDLFMVFEEPNSDFKNLDFINVVRHVSMGGKPDRLQVKGIELTQLGMTAIFDGGASILRSALAELIRDVHVRAHTTVNFALEIKE